MKQTALTRPKQLDGDRDRSVAGLRVLGRRHAPIWFRDHLKGTHCLTIGRVHQRDVRLRDDTVSRFHCIVERIDVDGQPQFRILDCDSTNGVLVSALGHYSEFREVDEATLHLGMLIRLGEHVLTPMNAAGLSPVVVARHSEYARQVEACYGSPAAASRLTGISRKLFARLRTRARAPRSHPTSA